MNGPEHYRRSELLAEAAAALLDEATPAVLDEASRTATVMALLAQTHATLANAAATAEGYAEQWSGNHQGRQWSEVIS